MDVRDSQDALGEIFDRIETFFKRLESYIEARPTASMTDVIVKIMVEVLSILGILTKEIGQGRMSTSSMLTYLQKPTFVQRSISRNLPEGRMSRMF